MSTDLVFYLHRLGVKIYQVSSASEIVDLVDIASTDSQEISSKLTSFSGKSFRLLIADTISYLFQTEIPDNSLSISRDIVLNKIKQEIPENFTDLAWDYKIISSDNDLNKILVFAPVLEFQNIITSVSEGLQITFEVIEPESIALTRDPNPVIGIMQKNDQRLRDEQTLNIAIKPTVTTGTGKAKKVVVIVALVIIVSTLVLLAVRIMSASKNAPVNLPTPTPIPTLIPTPTVIVVKNWEELTINVKNGTSRSGYAGQIAAKFTASGISQVTTGNADNNNYTNSKLTFKSDLLRKTYFSKFSEIFPIIDSDVNVDNSQSDDAILILGTN